MANTRLIVGDYTCPSADGRQTGSNPFLSVTRPAGDESAAVSAPPPASDPLGLNLLLMPGEHVSWRDVADGAVQTNVVVMLHVTLHQTPRIFE